MKLSESELNILMKKALKYDDHHFVDIQCVNLRSVLQELELARKLVHLQDKLLVAYRLGGKKGVGKIIDALQETRKAYDDLGKEANHEHDR